MQTSPPAPILLLEYEPMLRELLTLSLRRSGYDPQFIEVPTQARAHLLSLPTPTALLIDLHLPGVNALELLRTLRREGLLARPAVIVLSGMAFPEIIQQAIRSGADDFLVKPIDPSHLIERIRLHSARKSAGG